MIGVGNPIFKGGGARTLQGSPPPDSSPVTAVTGKRAIVDKAFDLNADGNVRFLPGLPH